MRGPCSLYKGLTPIDQFTIRKILFEKLFKCIGYDFEIGMFGMRKKAGIVRFALLGHPHLEIYKFPPDQVTGLIPFTKQFCACGLLPLLHITNKVIDG